MSTLNSVRILQSVLSHLDILIIVRKYKTDFTSHLQVNWIKTGKKKKKKEKKQHDPTHSIVLQMVLLGFSEF